MQKFIQKDKQLALSTRLQHIRSLLAISWISFVCICYLYYYLDYLYNSYPVLQQFRELGITEMIRRLVTP